MITVVDESLQISVPGWVADINSFRRWTDSPEFPEHGRIWWLCDEVWVDMSKEQIFTHNLLKTEYTVVLYGLTKRQQSGMVLSDGVLLSNFAADISGNPDAMYISNETFQSDRIRLLEGKD